MRTVKMLTRAHGMGLGSWEISLRSDISAGAPNSGRQPCKGPGKSSRQREEPVQGSISEVTFWEVRGGKKNIYIYSLEK